MPLVQCVPNFSEGRRTAVVEAIVQAITSASVHLLDFSSDPDHNRSVMTFVGEPQAVLEAAFRGVAKAAALIDLRQHNGVHPRIGAADVVPLIPLRDISLAACADLARQLGARIGDELSLPVYLYEAAAMRPERTNLTYVRRDPYETLVETIQRDPTRAPDYGSAQLGAAGAVAVGARAPLIAFNVYLDTNDVEIAKSIARAIREAGGGLPYVKALGLLVNGQAQVSMNLTDFHITSLFDIVKAIEIEAMRHGTTITHTELIGLIPQAALFDTALQYLKLPPAARSQILEHRLGAVTGDYREVLFE